MVKKVVGQDEESVGSRSLAVHACKFLEQNVKSETGKDTMVQGFRINIEPRLGNFAF